MLSKLLIFIVIVRISFILLPSFKIDMNSWQAWSERLVEVTPLNFYAPNYFADYFPGYLYMLWFLGSSFNLLFPHLTIFSKDFEIYLKAFTNIFDIATAYYIFKIIQKYQKKLSKFAAIIYLLNPALFFNSSVWGQVDGVLTFFLIYSSYTLLELKNSLRFSFGYALSILIKPQGLAVLPVTLVYFLGHFKFTKYFQLIFIPLLLIGLSLSFFLKDPVFGLFHLFQKSVSTYPYTSMFSYNFWSFTGWWIPDSNLFFGISYQIWGTVLYFTFLIIIIIPLIIKRGYKDNYLVYFASTLSIFTFFLFLTRIHERYLFPFFAFFLIIVFIKKSVVLGISYVILSIIHFINLYYVYYYYNFVYGNSKFVTFPVYEFLNENYNWLTLVNLIGFGLLVIIYYRHTFLIVKK